MIHLLNVTFFLKSSKVSMLLVSSSQHFVNQGSMLFCRTYLQLRLTIEWKWETVSWGGYLLCVSSLPPQLHRSSDDSFQWSRNTHTITFSQSSSSLNSLHQSGLFSFFLSWAHEICRSFAEASVTLFIIPAAPLPTLFLSHTHISAKCGGGGSGKG